LAAVALDLDTLVQGNPGTPLADKLEDALAKTLSALAELEKTPPDEQAALSKIEGAVGDLEAAKNDGLLDTTALMDELAGIARQLATTAIDDALASGRSGEDCGGPTVACGRRRPARRRAIQGRGSSAQGRARQSEERVIDIRAWRGAPASGTIRCHRVSGWLRAVPIAGAAGVEVSTHLYPEVAAHLMRVTERAHWLGWQDWADRIVAEPFELRNGHLIVPESARQRSCMERGRREAISLRPLRPGPTPASRRRPPRRGSRRTASFCSGARPSSRRA